MVYSSKATFVTSGNNLTGIRLTLGGSICSGSLKITTDHIGNQSLSPEGNDAGAVFMGMVRSGSPSQHTTLKESFNEGDATSGGGVSSSFPRPRGCNMVTPVVPITTTPMLENTSTLLTFSMVQLQTAAPQLGTMLLLE
jgi:hypothetical protein